MRPHINLLFVSLLVCFSSCEKSEKAAEHKDTTMAMPEDTVKVKEPSEAEKKLEWKEKFKNENEEMDRNLDSLKEHTKNAGNKIKTEVNQAIDKMKSEKKNIMNDSTNENVKENWEKFKIKSKNAIDSIEKKLKK